MSSENEWVRIERVIDAPISKVWDMWTSAELFASWYGPNGASVPHAEMDVVVGGSRKIAMSMGPKMTMWFTGVYKEVSAPSRLVYTESMCDEAGNIISPASMGMPEGSPETTEIIVELVEADGGTRMTMIHVGVPANSDAGGGWGQAFDKLAAQLG